VAATVDTIADRPLLLQGVPGWRCGARRWRCCRRRRSTAARAHRGTGSPALAARRLPPRQVRQCMLTLAVQQATGHCLEQFGPVQSSSKQSTPISPPRTSPAHFSEVQCCSDQSHWSSKMHVACQFSVAAANNAKLRLVPLRWRATARRPQRQLRAGGGVHRDMPPGLCCGCPRAAMDDRCVRCSPVLLSASAAGALPKRSRAQVAQLACPAVPCPAVLALMCLVLCVLTLLVDAVRRSAGAAGGTKPWRPLPGTAVRLLLDQGGGSCLVLI
jgi:hypothetical protein